MSKRRKEKKKKKKFRRYKKLYPQNHPLEPTNHHIIPVSRKNGGNISIVPRQKHDRYHELFHNLTPDEIIRHLVENYWNGQWHWVFKAIKNKKGGYDETN